MGHEHDGTALLGGRRAQEAQHRGRGLGVEVARGLVGEEDLGIADERATEGEALLLAAREGVREAVAGVLEAEALDQLVRAGHGSVATREASGPSRFSSPVNSGIRWKNWKTKPTCRRRSA